MIFANDDAHADRAADFHGVDFHGAGLRDGVAPDVADEASEGAAEERVLAVRGVAAERVLAAQDAAAVLHVAVQDAVAALVVAVPDAAAPDVAGTQVARDIFAVWNAVVPKVPLVVLHAPAVAPDALVSRPGVAMKVADAQASWCADHAPGPDAPYYCARPRAGKLPIAHCVRRMRRVARPDVPPQA